MFPLHMLSEPVLLRVGSTLLHFVWQGFAIAALAWLAMRCFSGATARRRYAISLASLALMAVCPFVTYGVLSLENAPDEFELAAWPRDADSAEQFSERAVSAGTAENSSDSAGLQTSFDWQRLSPLQAYLVPVWLTGVLVLSLRLLLGYAGIHWLR